MPNTDGVDVYEAHAAVPVSRQVIPLPSRKRILFSWGDSISIRNANPLGKRLYTLKEAAEYLGRSEWGVRDLIWSQVIPVVKQHGSRKQYLDINDLDAFIEKNKSIYN